MSKVSRYLSRFYWDVLYNYVIIDVVFLLLSRLLSLFLILYNHHDYGLHRAAYLVPFCASGKILRLVRCGGTDVFGKLPIKARSHSPRKADFRSEIDRCNLWMQRSITPRLNATFATHKGQCQTDEIVRINASLSIFAKPNVVGNLFRVSISFIYLYHSYRCM